jgi:hypothetical protein
MSKIDKVLLDRQAEISDKLKGLQAARAQIVSRLAHFDALIAVELGNTADTDSSVAEVAVLVSTGVIISEIVVDQAKVVDIGILESDPIV